MTKVRFFSSCCEYSPFFYQRVRRRGGFALKTPLPKMLRARAALVFPVSSNILLPSTQTDTNKPKKKTSLTLSIVAKNRLPSLVCVVFSSDKTWHVAVGVRRLRISREPQTVSCRPPREESLVSGL